jgi:hypothetical protein
METCAAQPEIRPEGEGRSPVRLLVLVDHLLPAGALAREVVSRLDGRPGRVMLVAPALNSPLKYWLSDEDQARARAHDRLAAMLGELTQHGLQADGFVGDPDPLQAADDALRRFNVEELFILGAPPGDENWREKDLVRRARAAFGAVVSLVSPPAPPLRSRPLRGMGGSFALTPPSR